MTASRPKPIRCYGGGEAVAPEPDALVATFKVLGDGTRLQIVNLLHRAEAPLCACEIEACFDLSQPTISHHLRLLREAGLVTARRRGTWMYYDLAPEALATAGTFIARLTVAAGGVQR